MAREEIPDHLPHYRLLRPFFADDTFFEEGMELYFDGTPNEWMEPLNEAAKKKSQIYLAFINSLPVGGKTKSIDELVQEALLRNGSDLEGAVRDAVSRLTQIKQGKPAETSQVILPKREEVPVMNNLPGQRRRGRPPTKSVAAAVAPTTEAKPKKQIGTVLTEKPMDPGAFEGAR